MTPIKKRGDVMADETRKRIEEQEEQKRKTMETDKNIGGRPQTQAAEEKDKDKENDKDKIFHEEIEKDGVVTVVSALTQEDAERAKRIAEATPKFENLTQAMHGVVGIINLTGDGTLNNDGTVKQEETELKAVGPNPMPNRVGNELTRIEQGFMAARFLGNAAILKKMREMNKDLKDEDKKQLESIEKSLLGVSS